MTIQNLKAILLVGPNLIQKLAKVMKIIQDYIYNSKKFYTFDVRQLTTPLTLKNDRLEHEVHDIVDSTMISPTWTLIT